MSAGTVPTASRSRFGWREMRPRRAVNPVPRRLADISAAARHIGFRPTIDFDDGLCHLVAWWRQQGRQDMALAAEQGAR